MSFAFALSALLALALLIAGAATAPSTAQAQGEGKKVLIYTGTTGFRHSDAINNGRPVLQGALEDIGFEVDWEDCNGFGTGSGQCQNTDKNPRIFTGDNLSQYDALVFFNVSDYWSGAGGSPGQLFNASQENAIIAYVQNGGGIVANHNATDAAAGQESWDWWDGDDNSVVGTTMAGHAATDLGNVAQVQSVDQHHLANRQLPDEWGLGDEHYNYDRNVRGTHHVVAELDERTYSPGGNGMGQDHPISWCRSYDGDNVDDGTGNPKSYDDGRTFVTGIGHFGQNYTQNGGDNNVVKHLVGAIRWASGEGKKSDCGGTVWSNFTREVLVSDANNPIAIDVAGDGKVYWSEIGPQISNTSEGYIKMHDPEGPPNNQTTVATIPTRADHGNSEDGVLGMSLEPGFDLSDPDKRDIYVYYSPRFPGFTENNAYMVGYNLISRFTVTADGTAFEPNSEREILRVPKVKLNGGPSWCAGCPGGNGPGHVGGAGLVFDSDGNLYLGVGDDVSPNEGGHNAYPPLDYRAVEHRDARKTSANTGDLRGKVLRITPLDEIPADTEPGLGQTYTTPAGNMFEPGNPAARPEIYAMGFRQPFTLHTDPANPGVVGVGEYCHDAGGDAANRAPAGTCEWNLINEPAFHGWPFCMGPNTGSFQTYRWNYGNGTSTGEQYDCSLQNIPSDLDWAPAGQDNPGPTNPGLANIPGPAKAATIWKKTGGANQPNPLDFGNLSAGGNQPLAGPIYRYDNDLPPGAFPAYYDGSWFINNRGSNNGFWKEVTMREDGPAGEMLRVQDWLPYNQPAGSPAGSESGQVIGTRFGPDGALYMARFAVGCCRSGINAGQQTQIVKISFNVQDVCEQDTQAPDVSHAIAGKERPGQPGTYINGATLSLRADDIGCAGVDTIEWREAGETEWQTYSGPIEFNDAGDYEIEYRATDDMENESAVETAEFTVELVEDTEAPTVEADVTGTQDQRGFFVLGATLNLAADDGGGTGVASIEYRVNGGEWQAYTDAVTFTNPGSYTVDYRATDVLDNTSEPGTVDFRVINGQGCVSEGAPNPEFSDEFDATEIGSQWLRHTRNGGTPTEGELAPFIEAGQLVLPTNDFELDGNNPDTATGPVNFLGIDLPALGDEWQVETQLTVQHTGGWQHTGLIVWEGDNNFFRSTITNNLSSSQRTIYIEQSKDNPTSPEGDRVQAGGNQPVTVGGAPEPITIKMRYTRTAGANSVVGEYQIVAPESLANEDWVSFPATNNTWLNSGGLDLNPAGGPRRDAVGSRIGIIAAGNFPGQSGNNQYEGDPAEVYVDYFHVSGVQMVCEADAPTTTASLDPADPGPGGTYEQPVGVTLSATDGDEGASGVARTEYRITKDDEAGDWTVRNNGGGNEPFDTSFTLNSSGDYEIEFRSIDNAGNEEETQSIAFTIDTGGCVPMRSDEFDGSAIDTNKWEIVRTPDGLEAEVEDGHLVLPVAMGDIHNANTGPISFAAQKVPAGEWEATTKVTVEHTNQWQHVGMMVWADDDNYSKFAWTRNATNREFEFQTEQNGSRQWHGPRIQDPGNWPDTMYLRLASDGDMLHAYYSADGESWTEMGEARAVWWDEDAYIGLNAQGDEGATQIYADFDYFRITPDDFECASPCVHSDEFDAMSIDPRWEIVRTPDGLDAELEDGRLVLPVAMGDIHEANGGPISFVGQPVPDGDWTVETLVDITHSIQWQHAGLTIWADDDNYSKLAFTRNNGGGRFFEFQTEQNGSREWHGTNINVDGAFPTSVHMRLTKEGNTLSAAYSEDGESWTPMNGTANVWWDSSAYIGLNAQGDEGAEQIYAGFDYFRVDPDDCSGGPGDDDTVAPITTIQLTPPPNGEGEYEAPVTAMLTATDNEGGSGVEKTEYRIDGGEWTLYNPLSPPTVTEPGEHTIEARSTDKAGNVEDPPASVTFTIAGIPPLDGTAPITTASLDPEDPGPGGTYDDSVTVNLSATDPAGAGGGNPQTHEITGFGFDWTPAELEINAGDTVEWDWTNGSHDLCVGETPLPESTPFSECVEGYEMLGSSVVPQEDPLYAHSASRQFDEPGEYGYYCSVHFPSMSGVLTVNPSDGGTVPGSGVATTEYRIDGADWQENENTGGDDPFETSFMVSGEGEHTVEFRSTDAAGNVEETKSVEFTIAEGGEPVGEPALAIKANPKRKAVRKKAKRVAFNVRIANRGDAAATGVRVCAKAPKKKIRILSGGKQGCQKVGKIAAGGAQKLRFQVKPKAKAVGKKTRIKFIVNAKNADRQVAVVNLKVRKK